MLPIRCKREFLTKKEVVRKMSLLIDFLIITYRKKWLFVLDATHAVD